MYKKPALAIFTGVSVFAAVFATRLLVVRFDPQLPPFYRQFILEILLAAVSIIVALAVFRLPLSTFSFRRNFVKKIAGRYSLFGMLMGMLVTVCMLTFHIPSVPVFKLLQPLQLFTILFMASISEELLTRGLVQGIVPDRTPLVTIGSMGISGGVLAAAIVFSLIHFSIYITGGSGITCMVTMASTFILGIAAGIAREKSNLGAAILTHLSFNVGGIAAAILINIGSMIITGHLINT